MAIPALHRKRTYEDYRRTPDDERYELLDGELIMVPAPRVDHQLVVLRLAGLLQAFVEERGLGVVLAAPCDVVLSDTDVVQPDVLFVSRERAHLIVAENVRGAPDLVVEVLSPSTGERDRTVKRALYARHGVREYWQVDTPARTVTVLRAAGADFRTADVYRGDQVARSAVLDGFGVGLERLFGLDALPEAARPGRVRAPRPPNARRGRL